KGDGAGFRQKLGSKGFGATAHRLLGVWCVTVENVRTHMVEGAGKFDHQREKFLGTGIGAARRSRRIACAEEPGEKRLTLQEGKAFVAFLPEGHERGACAARVGLQPSHGEEAGKFFGNGEQPGVFQFGEKIERRDDSQVRLITFGAKQRRQVGDADPIGGPRSDDRLRRRDQAVREAEGARERRARCSKPVGGGVIHMFLKLWPRTPDWPWRKACLWERHCPESQKSFVDWRAFPWGNSRS